jgi:hypothetical protein
MVPIWSAEKHLDPPFGLVLLFHASRDLLTTWLNDSYVVVDKPPGSTF